MKNADLPAMPTQKYDYLAATNGIGVSVTDQYGLTKREHFAAIAMQGFLAGNSLRELAELAKENKMGDIGEVVKIMSLNFADKMLAEDDKQ